LAQVTITLSEALKRAIAAQKSGKLAEAEQLCRGILGARPDHFDALHLLAIAQSGRGRREDAVASFDRALAVRPGHAQALSNRGITLRELGRVAEAKASYDKAIEVKPGYAEAHYNRGNLFHEQKRYAEALADFDAAVASRPEFAAAYNNRGLALHELQRSEDALASYDRAIALQPDFAAAHNNRGNTLQRLKRYDEALASYDKALALKADYPEALNNRGLTLREMKRFDESLESCEKSIALRPDYPEALYLRGTLLRTMNRRAEALDSYGKALAAKPDYAEAHLAACMTELPILYADAAEINTQRAAYERRLRTLIGTVERGTNLADFAKAVGSNQPFFLAYQGRNDRDLQALYGALVCKIIGARYGTAPLAPPAKADEKVRVGIVSGYFNQHSNWKVPIKGWLGQLDRKRFRLFGYYTGSDEDSATRAAKSLCERFVRGPLTVERWREEILADAPHVLIYPEVGMDPVSVSLAAQRLAKAQCNSWGHPDTSGFPTLDYYLSSDLMEPPEAHAHYTERLVRLPNLSVYYEPLKPPPTGATRHDFGMREGATVYWCGQSTFKFLPQYDGVFARIAREAGDCQFAFLENPGAKQITELFRDRLKRAFAAEGLDAERYCLFLRRLDMREFVAVTGLCDVFLDSIGWSGCNTTLESLVHDLPIVTHPGTLMRARHSAAVLRMLGAPETIAASIDEYVALAVRLAREPELRTAIKAKIAAGKQRVYRDGACIAALEHFLERVGRAA
jgi:protein O-GlcNAc transferase